MKRKIWTVTPFFIVYTVAVFAMASRNVYRHCCLRNKPL